MSGDIQSGASSALQSMLAGGGGGADPSLQFGSDLAGKEINEGAKALALGSHAQAMTMMRQNQGMSFGAGSILAFLKKLIQLDGEEIRQIFARAKDTSAEEITGAMQLAEIAGNASHAEVASAGGAAVESIDVSQFANMNLQGVEAGERIVPNAPAASGNQTQIG